MGQLIEYASPSPARKLDRPSSACVGFGVSTCFSIALVEGCISVFVFSLQHGFYLIVYFGLFGIIFLLLAAIAGTFYGLLLWIYEVIWRRRTCFNRTKLPTFLTSIAAGGLIPLVPDFFGERLVVPIAVSLMAAPAVCAMIILLTTSEPAAPSPARFEDLPPVLSLSIYPTAETLQQEGVQVTMVTPEPSPSTDEIGSVGL